LTFGETLKALSRQQEKKILFSVDLVQSGSLFFKSKTHLKVCLRSSSTQF